MLDLETGAELRRFSIWEALQASPWAPRTQGIRPNRIGDPMHTNTLKVLDGRYADEVPAFAQGNLLLSMRETDHVLVVDPETVSVVWMLQGPWRKQHEPTLVPPGHLLVFDNLGVWPRSRALELDPRTQRVVWSYDGGRTPIISETCGVAQRLPNGNTVIVASDTGRVAEVDRDGVVHWAWSSPYRAGDDRELVATLFQAQRLWGDDLGVFAAAVPAASRPETGSAPGGDTDVEADVEGAVDTVFETGPGPGRGG